MRDCSIWDSLVMVCAESAIYTIYLWLVNGLCKFH